MASPVNGTPGLVVPVDVVAFCVGTTDPERTAKFAGATVNYNLFANQGATALLGGNVTRGFQDTMDALEPGVHLHWALPDALTRANGGDLAFPTVPNRWLVTRIVVAGEALTPTSFLVESDVLSSSSTQSGAIVIPVQPPKTAAAAQPVAFEYLGQATPLHDYVRPSARPRALADGTPLELTAVSNGVPTFAAYYPEGRNSFGFHDPVAALPPSAILLYVVTGWYENTANDPATQVHGVAGARRTLAETHDWQCTGTETYTLYSGSVQHVVWSAQKPYVPENPAPITADAVIANSPSEALAAWFANSMNLGGVLPEQLLTAFQQGLWDRVSQPSSTLLPQLLERLHDSQFRSVDSGLVYSIHQTVDGQDEEAINLPLGIAQALDALNSTAASALQIENQVDALRWQVFADWYRYFASGSDPNAAAEQAAIFTHFGQTLMPLWDPGLKEQYAQSQSQLVTAVSALSQLLDARPDLSLRREPGPRYYRPNDPVLLLRSDDLALSSRYGGDNDSHPSGKLLARPTDALVSAVKVGAVSRTAANYATATSLPTGKLPYAADCSALLAEAILLDVDVASAWTGQTVATLDAALTELLAGQTGGAWNVTAGTAPSPVAVDVWSGNPWLPLFLTWDVGFAALSPTLQGTTLTDYDPAFFTANFSVDASTGSFLSYTPNGPKGISVDPKQADYSAHYADGWAMLSSKPGDNFRAQIATYLQNHADTTLQQIGASLDASSFLVQPIAGLTDRLVNRNTLMQVSVVTTPQMGANASQLTQATAAVLASGSGPATYHATPVFGDPFNPLRAGWLSFGALHLMAVDAFGQRRPVQVNTSYVGASMAASPPGGTAVEPGIVYAAPRLAQGARLLFQWLSAADNTTAEYNGHPTESPICGFLLPDHLTSGFFVYDASGRPLGSLFAAGSDVAGTERVVWQGAPGNDRDIDTGIVADPVVAATHPELRALLLHLGTISKVSDFQAFYAAVDAAHSSINPSNLATDAGLTVLIGRPVALVQAALTLDLRGPPLLDQNRTRMNGEDGAPPYWVDSDAGLNAVKFPVLLGDHDDLDDGLVGYFVQSSAGGYDLGTFYSDAAPVGAKGAVVPPTAQTLLVTPTPTAGTATPSLASPLRVLMLVDPRAPVHAITGILPTQSLLVPPYLASAAMSTLEISLQIAPVLRSAGGLALPTPAEPGFELAYLEQLATAGTKLWYTLPQITPAVATALWSYTPQSLAEGWLRFNPALLTATLLNAQGQPLATGGQVQALTLRLQNRKSTSLRFTPGTTAPEGQPATGSIFYVHFDALVADTDFAGLTLSADGWTFTQQSDQVYGTYFAATRRTLLTLGASDAPDPPDSFDVTVSGLKAATSITQAHVHVDYYDVEGIDDGLATATVTVTQTSSVARRTERQQ